MESKGKSTEPMLSRGFGAGLLNALWISLRKGKTWVYDFPPWRKREKKGRERERERERDYVPNISFSLFLSLSLFFFSSNPFLFPLPPPPPLCVGDRGKEEGKERKKRVYYLSYFEKRKERERGEEREREIFV
jgi:hypothetical protein